MNSDSSQSVKELRALAALAKLKKNRPPLTTFIRDAWEFVEPARYSHNWHVDVLCERLDTTAQAPDHRLMINVPPGHMKSLLVNVFYPAWVWGPYHWPQARFLHASYSQTLSTRDSVKCRELISSEWYQSRWPHVRIKRDQDQKTQFDLIAGGGRQTTSVGGMATGMHPHFIVIDDPTSAQQAMSKTYRDRANHWIASTMSTRGRALRARWILMMQRLHEDDMSGFVLQNEPDDWDHVCLPARFEPAHPFLSRYDIRTEEGQLLWPELFPENVVESIARSLGNQATGQLQQRPSAASGEYYKRHWFETVRSLPMSSSRSIVACRYWDKAGTAGGGDYSAGVLVVKVGDYDYFIADVVKGQWSSDQRNKIMKETAKQDAMMFQNYRVGIEQEPGAGGKESMELSIKLLQGFKVCPRASKPSKEVDWQPYAGYLEAGNIKLIEADWNKDFIDEHLAANFVDGKQMGKHDDQIDAACGAFKELATGSSVNLAAWA